MSKYPSIPDPGSTDQGLQAAVRALRQAVNLLTGAAGDGSNAALTHEGVKHSVERALNNVVRPDLQTLDGAITEANIARAAAFAELDKALSELANGQSSSVLQGQINDIGVATDNAAAAVVDERAARIDGDDALAGQISALTATVNNNTAAIVNESVVRAQQDNSIAATVSTLTSTANRAVSFIQGVQPSSSTLKIGDLWVNTSQGNSLFRWNGSTWDNVDNNAIAQNTAAITNEQTARTTADSALSNSVTTLSTRVDNNTSSISTQQSSLNGVLAQYTITGTINGVTGKFSFGGVKKADGSVSFGVEIDGGLVIKDNTVTGGKIAQTTITGDKIVTGTITGNLIAANQINANHIQASSIDAVRMVAGTITTDSGVIGHLGVKSLSIGDNAVTVPQAAIGNGVLGGTGTQYAAFINLPIDTTGLAGKEIDVLITFTGQQGLSSGSGTWAAGVSINGVIQNPPLGYTGGSTFQPSFSTAYVHKFIASGTASDGITIQGVWSGNSSVTLFANSVLTAVCVKR